MPSYYCPELNYTDSVIRLTGEEHHHLSRVKRAFIGQEVLLNSGKGLLAKAVVKAIDKQGSTLEVLNTIGHQRENPSFAIAFSLLKNRRDEYLIEKCSELGVKEFFPFISEYTVTNVGKNTLLRYRGTALAAIKQCDNPWLPNISPVVELKQLLISVPEIYQPVICYEGEEEKWFNRDMMEKDICFIIGPEGGFSADEVKSFSNFPKITVSKNVLRADTAAIAIASQFSLLRGLPKS